MSLISDITPFSPTELVPLEEMIEVRKKKGSLYIGIPKETHYQERRVCLSPDAVGVMVANGHQVCVESGAGEGANYSDQEYTEAGAKLSYDRKEVFGQPIVLKVAPPSSDELELIKPKSTLISALHLKVLDKGYFETLAAKKITGIAFNFIRDEHGLNPIVQSLSEIAGTTSVLIAAELMSNINSGSGLMLGGIPGVAPAEVVILGGGTVGKNAAKAALGLGANVKIFDNSVSKLRQLQDDLGQRVYTSTVQPKLLLKALMRCDVLIGAVGNKGGRVATLVTEEMVMKMKSKAVIVDVSIDQGGCIETSEVTTHKRPTFEKHEVVHYGVSNIPSRVARTASLSLSNIFLPYLLSIGEEGGIDVAIRKNKGLRNGIYLFKGMVVHKGISERYDLPFRDIDLLMIGF